MNLRLWIVIFPALLAVVFFPSAARADSEPSKYIEVHAFDPLEPNTIGYTFDDDDVPFLDIKLSVRVSVLRPLFRNISDRLELNAGLTGRIGQYIGRRQSSPVVGKRYNPELFIRYRYRSGVNNRDDGHIDLGYAHESNGQAITTPEAFAQAQANAERPEYAKDLISRGWDYLHVSVKSPELLKPLKLSKDDQKALNLYLTYKYFLSRGALQGDAEEYNDWENDPEGKPRDEVNGVGGLLKFVYCKNKNEDDTCMTGGKFAVIYETGYHPVFRNNTYRGELGGKFWGLPEIMAWASRGYNSDLAQYYKKVDSWGVAFVIGGF